VITSAEYVERAVSLGTAAPEGECPSCDRYFWEPVNAGEDPRWLIFPRHKASNRCQSGERPHCTCDTCF